MTADRMNGQLRAVEAELLGLVQENVDAGRDLYGVPSWRGRWVLVRSLPEGYMAVRTFNRSTFRVLEARDRIVIAEAVTDLPVVAGMTFASGGRWAPHPEQGYRVTLPEKTGDDR